MKTICRFSCGAPSAVATKLTLHKHEQGEIIIAYNDTGAEHPDNVRFLADCEQWYGQPIQVLRSAKYVDTWDVWERERYLVNVHGGAKCTTQLKKLPGNTVWEIGDAEVFGYTLEERRRVDGFRRSNPERVILTPLIDAKMKKQDCIEFLRNSGIEPPVMYSLGFKNNNCIPCVKARDSVTYWNRIRKHFPAEFDRMASLEREIGMALNRTGRDRTPTYLDELPFTDPSDGGDPQISCGLFCGMEGGE